jgi:hypothetical protein
MAESLLDIKKQSVELVVGKLKDTVTANSHQAGLDLLRAARKHAVPLRDYLTLAVDTRAGTTYAGLTGYEAALAYLNLPVKDDFKEGIVLNAASETFQTYPGTRALFPPVIDDMLYWTKRLDQIEQLEPLLAGSLTVAGAELLFTIVDDTGYEYNSFVVPEMGKVPVRSLRTSESAVKMWKHGSGIRTSYEFSRRARLDLLTPFAARVQRELSMSKIKAATSILVNGDGSANSASPVVTQSSFNTLVGSTATVGTIAFQNFLAWLVNRASNGVPIDTVVGNWDAMFQYMRLFSPIVGTTSTFEAPTKQLQEMSGMTLQIPHPFPTAVRFALSSAMPEGMLLGMTSPETLQELKEAGGDTSEEEREPLNQTITYIRTEVSGFRLLYRDTRSVYNYAA